MDARTEQRHGRIFRPHLSPCVVAVNDDTTTRKESTEGAKSEPYCSQLKAHDLMVAPTLEMVHKMPLKRGMREVALPIEEQNRSHVCPFARRINVQMCGGVTGDGPRAQLRDASS